MFKRLYRPTDQIQALVNLGSNVNNIKKVTMSLYMMIEIKDPNQTDAILSKYTLCQRIYQTVHDFRATHPNKKDIQQRGIIMTLDLDKMNKFYQLKRAYRSSQTSKVELSTNKQSNRTGTRVTVSNNVKMKNRKNKDNKIEVQKQTIGDPSGQNASKLGSSEAQQNQVTQSQEQSDTSSNTIGQSSYRELHLNPTGAKNKSNLELQL
jgi:hypothetical protein